MRKREYWAKETVHGRERGSSIDDQIEEFSNDYFESVVIVLVVWVVLTWAAIAWATAA